MMLNKLNNTKLSFLYLNVINDKFYGADYELNSSYIRSYLSSKTIETLQYINLNITTLNGFIEDIINTLNGKLVFYINEYNFYINKVVINSLKLRSMDFEIIAIGPSVKFIRDSTDNIYSDVMIDHYCVENEYIKLENIAYSNYNYSEYDEIDIKDIPPIYSTGIVPANEIINLGLITSKGCKGKCNFCSYTQDGIFNCYDIDIVIKELKYIKNSVGEKNIEIKFYDDCFTISEDRIIEFCNKVILNKLNFNFWCCTRLDLLSEEVLNKLKEANFNNIVIGLESASPRVLNNIGKLSKSETPESFLVELKNKYNYAKSIGLNLIISINIGLIGEELEDIYKTFKYLEDNDIKHISINYMTIFSDSRLFRRNNYILDNCTLSPTKLPLRTYYNKFNMAFINDIIKSSMYKKYQFTFNEFKEKAEFLEYYTGVSSIETSYLKNGIRFIEIDSFNNKNIDFIKKNLLLNGYVLHNSNKLTLKNKNGFCDNRKIVKLAINEYDTALENCYNKDCYIENQYITNKMDKKYIVKINNSLNSNYEKYNYFKEFSSSMLNLLEINYKKFLYNPKISGIDIRESIINNMCMFSNKCTSISNLRVSINDNNLHLCNNNIKFSIKDNLSDIYKKINAYKGSYNAQCSNCIANDTCSKCIGVNENEKALLCKFIQTNKDIYIFINTIIFIYKNFNILDDEKVWLYSNMNSNLDNKYNKFSNEIIIIKLKNIFIIYNAKSKLHHLCTNVQNKVIRYLLEDKISLLKEHDILELLLLLKNNKIL